MPAWGERNLTLSLGSFSCSFPFILAAVPYPILGTDFLAHHHLLVDTQHHQVLHSNNLQPLLTATTVVPPLPLVAAIQAVPTPVHQLLSSFPTVFNPDIAASHPTHGVEHHIHTTGPPVFAKAHRLDATSLQQAKAEFDKLEATGLFAVPIAPGLSPFL